MKRMKKWFSIFLVIVFTMTLVPTTAFAATPKTDAEVLTRIYELNDLFGGKYFTVNQQPCNKERKDHHSCGNCNVYKIIKAKWFKEKYGNVKSAQLPGLESESCLGFANFAGWYIFREDNSDTVQNVKSEVYAFNYENIRKYAQVGDHIRVDGHHSVILIDYDKTGLTVLDSNFNGPQCMVQIHPYSFKGRNEFVIYRGYSKAVGHKPTFKANTNNETSDAMKPSTLYFYLPSKSYPEGTLQQGKSFTLKGSIKSNYSITYVKGEIFNSAGDLVQWKELTNGKSKSVSIQSTVLNKQLKFGSLTPGSYTLKYTATDSSGKTVDISKAFTVAGKNTPVTAKKYTITLNAQGGTVSKKSIQVEEGKPYGNLPSATKSGYTFKGWFANAAGTGNALTAGTVIPAKNHTIYAKWEKVQTPAPTPVPTPTTNCNGNHTKGAFVRTEKEHPHMDIYKCKACGKQFESGSTKCISSCQICNPLKDCNGRHTKGAFVRTEKVHPHKNVYECKVCGKEYEDGSTKYISSCQTCNPVKQLIKAPAAKVIMNTGATLKNSVKSDDVRRLQMNLNTLGFNCGSADGAYGNNTKKAVIGFQNDQGLTADGIAGRNTLTRMVDIAVTVQTQLYQLGYYTGNIDGVMGSGTQTALKKFQKENGFTQNGLATANVRNALAKAVR